MNEQNFFREVGIWTLRLFAAILIIAALFNNKAPKWLVIPGGIFLGLSWLARVMTPKSKDGKE